jgi:hypothetical protein
MKNMSCNGGSLGIGVMTVGKTVFGKTFNQGKQMMSDFEYIQDPELRTIAEQCQTSHKGDFGMTVYGGVDLEAFAAAVKAKTKADLHPRHVVMSEHKPVITDVQMPLDTSIGRGRHVDLVSSFSA